MTSTLGASGRRYMPDVCGRAARAEPYRRDIENHIRAGNTTLPRLEA